MSEELHTLIYNKALDLISRREHSQKEIRNKLLIRYEDNAVIESVISKLISNNLINNFRFAELYLLNRKRKGFGPKKIFYELVEKGISDSISNEIISQEKEWDIVAKKAFFKKFKDGPSIDIKIKSKQKAFLVNRGFSFKEIESVFTNDMLWFCAMSYEVLARKYRPTNFQEVVGQDHIIKALTNSIDQSKIHQAYIFSGTRGIGKTTVARILAKCLNCESNQGPISSPCSKCSNCTEIKLGRSVDFLEIDAASNTQVEKIRDLIETVEYKPAKGRFKVYLIDEVHMLSTASFNALLKTLEEPPAHVIFIFATTNPEKIPKTVQSRCLQLNLKTVNEELLSEHLKKVLANEDIKFDDESVNLISNSARGSVRDALTLLDQAIAYSNGLINKEDIKKLLGTIDDSLLFSLIKSVIQGNGKEAFETLHVIEELNPEYDVILRDIISILHQISLQQIIESSKSDSIVNIALEVDKEFCQLLYEIALNAYSKFSVHPNPKEALEICLLRMLTFNPLQKLTNNKEVDEEKKPEKKNLNESKVKIIDEEINKSQSDNNFSLNSNDEWVIFFNTLEMSPFARNYFGNMSFNSFKDNNLILNVDPDTGNIPENIFLEFKSVIGNSISQEINILTKVNDVNESPLSVKANEEIKKKDEADTSIKNDNDIQNFIKKFDGKIKSNTIKPLK